MIRKTRAQGIVIRQGTILMVRHYDLYIGEEYWCFPGGAIEAGESGEQAVKRELFEETGLIVEVGPLIYRESYPDVHQGYVAAQTYWAEVKSGALKLGYDPEQAEWEQKFLREVKWQPIHGELLQHLNHFIFSNADSASTLLTNCFR